MNLTQFTADLRANLRTTVDRFERHWREHREADPATYLDDMSEEEWQEQFLVFMDTNDGRA